MGIIGITFCMILSLANVNNNVILSGAQFVIAGMGACFVLIPSMVVIFQIETEYAIGRYLNLKYNYKRSPTMRMGPNTAKNGSKNQKQGIQLQQEVQVENQEEKDKEKEKDMDYTDEKKEGKGKKTYDEYLFDYDTAVEESVVVTVWHQL
ncbi:hypothetical protein AX774_g5939 [Zancudomyces culisetae]|uniref:Uncharacterized protein n=1 Tax=Zancudomyces culisetae TaxID=1213189 RepID=A0A1R1PI40_ZANCU|nr:hypothetical protein AX774_g5939 [Zancudomyces culisetae]|eukprot:OMH80617.1 hypothetical protein AX774_g5939 [Zancudomyces culisetae]